MAKASQGKELKVIFKVVGPAKITNPTKTLLGVDTETFFQRLQAGEYDKLISPDPT